MAQYPPSSNEGSAVPLHPGYAPTHRDLIDCSRDEYRLISSTGMAYLGYGVAFLAEMHKLSSYSHCGVCSMLTPFGSLREYSPQSALLEPLQGMRLFDDASVSDGKFAVCEGCAHNLSLGHVPAGIFPNLGVPEDLARLTLLEKVVLSPTRNFFVHVVVQCHTVTRPNFTVHIIPAMGSLSTETTIPLSVEELGERVSFEFVGRFNVAMYQCGQFRISATYLAKAIETMVKAQPALEKQLDRSVLAQYSDERAVPTSIREMIRTKRSTPGFVSANLSRIDSSVVPPDPKDICPYLFHDAQYCAPMSDSKSIRLHAQKCLKTHSLRCASDAIYVCVTEERYRRSQLQERFSAAQIPSWAPVIEDRRNIFASTVKLLGSISGGLHAADAIKPLLRAHIAAFGGPSFAIFLDTTSLWERSSSFASRSPARILSRLVNVTAPNPFWIGNDSFVEEYLHFSATVQSFCRNILGWNYEMGHGEGVFGEIDAYFARIAVDSLGRLCVVIMVWKSTPYPPLTIQETRLASNVMRVVGQTPGDPFSSRLGMPRVNDTISSVLEGVQHQIFFFDQSSNADLEPTLALLKLCSNTGFPDDDLSRIIAAHTLHSDGQGDISVEEVIRRSVETVLSSTRLSPVECTASLLGKPPFLSSHDFVNFPVEVIQSWIEREYDPSDPSSILETPCYELPPPLIDYASRDVEIFHGWSIFSYYMRTVPFDDAVWSPFERKHRISLPLLNASTGKLDVRDARDALLLLVLFKPWRRVSEVLYNNADIVSSLAMLYLVSPNTSKLMDGFLKLFSLEL